MPYGLHFYQDQILGGGKTGGALASLPRLVHVRFGEVAIDGRAVKAGETAEVRGGAGISGVADWSWLWRWEIDLPNAPRALLEDAGALTLHRMSRVITMLDMPQGSEWLFRLDQVTAPAGRVTDPHEHPGPGIRCMMEGTFNVQQDGESVRMVNPGDPWWESGRDEVVAWGARTMHARFLRGMVLPVEHAGKVTGIWKAGGPHKKRGDWVLHIDRIVTVPDGSA